MSDFEILKVYSIPDEQKLLAVVRYKKVISIRLCVIGDNDRIVFHKALMMANSGYDIEHDDEYYKLILGEINSIYENTDILTGIPSWVNYLELSGPVVNKGSLYRLICSILYEKYKSLIVTILLDDDDFFMDDSVYYMFSPLYVGIDRFDWRYATVIYSFDKTSADTITTLAVLNGMDFYDYTFKGINSYDMHHLDIMFMNAI